SPWLPTRRRFRRRSGNCIRRATTRYGRKARLQPGHPLAGVVLRRIFPSRLSCRAIWAIDNRRPRNNNGSTPARERWLRRRVENNPVSSSSGLTQSSAFRRSNAETFSLADYSQEFVGPTPTET